MIVFDAYFWLFCLAFLIWLVFRIMSLRNLATKDQRHFWPVLLWLALLFIHLMIIPKWWIGFQAFQIIFVALCFGLAIDGFYYFILKAQAPGAKRQKQVGLAAICLIGCFFWLQRTPQSSLVLTLPMHGEGLVWHTPIFAPNNFYFLKNQTTRASGSESYDDPNYGQAIFAPCSGKILGFNTQSKFLEIAPETAPDTIIQLGPFMEETLRTKPGDKIFEKQPLGLLGKTSGTPGIQLKVEGSQRVVFGSFLAGNFWAREYERGVPKRNQKIRNQGIAFFNKAR